jgi:hypothetical protein
MAEPDRLDEELQNVEQLAAAAEKLGVEFNQADARQWLMAVSAADRGQPWAQDCLSGVFGSQVALADFDQDDLDYFRRLAGRVRLAPWPGVESAIAIAGSSAQGKFQLFPGDVDFFERVNIRAATETAARQTLRELLRASALHAFAEPDIVLTETNFGVYPWPGEHRGAAHQAGDSILWSPEEVLAGEVILTDAAGHSRVLRWGELEAGVGWSYLGWIVADRLAGRIVLVGNMLDATWERPDGAIVALDGALDAFFQEVYLDSESLPIFSKITRHLDPGARQAYASNMRSQVHHYIHVAPSYCKATKRLYNLLRITDELEAAAYLRELFDEPRAQLYQADGLLEAARLASDIGSGIDRAMVLRQIEQVQQAVALALDGPEELELVDALRVLHNRLSDGLAVDAAWDDELRAIQRRSRELVDLYFRDRLFGMPLIADYLATL